MSAQREILIATGNMGKLREIERVLSDVPAMWRSLADFADLPPAVEDGDTFTINAAKKAKHFSRLAGCWTLADDSGLEVDALGGAPGVHSARFAGQPTDDAANNAKLIAALAEIPPQDRTARFRCALVLADGDSVLLSVEGSVEGVIVDPPRGGNGFGYDPHFLLPESGMTTAEMSPEQKNRISHRGRALAAIVPLLDHLLREAS